MPLPKFRDPPVVECVIGLHFKRLVPLTSARLGQFWGESLSANFPNAENRPPIEQIQETFGPPQARWEFGASLIPHRIWARSLDGGRTVQIQQDAIFTNWQKLEGQTHVGYAERKQVFCDNWNALDGFVGDHGLGKLVPTVCSLTYVNRVQAEHSKYERMSHYIEGLSRDYQSSGYLPNPEAVTFSLAFPFPAENSRLRIDAKSFVEQPSGMPVARLQLAARGQPRAENIEAALNWMDLAHEWIVRGFDAITTEPAHEEWGKENV